jgi:hypothetical protein
MKLLEAVLFYAARAGDIQGDSETNDRPDLSSVKAPQNDKTLTVKQYQTSSHKNQKELETKTHWKSQRGFDFHFDFA